jgi:hypothetical protein
MLASRAAMQGGEALSTRTRRSNSLEEKMKKAIVIFFL